MHRMQAIERELGKKTLPRCQVGDTVEVHYLIKEGERERVQRFIGTVIALKGRGIARSITVRRVSGSVTSSSPSNTTTQGQARSQEVRMAGVPAPWFEPSDTHPERPSRSAEVLFPGPTGNRWI